MTVYSFVEGVVVLGVVPVIIPLLELRYGLSSSISAILVSSYDFGSYICHLVVGYFGETGHKPRIMGTGVLIMVIGGFVFVLPHFIGDSYRYTVSGKCVLGPVLDYKLIC